MIINIAALVSTAAAVGGALWWLYRRGQAAGRIQERLDRLEKELEAARSRRRDP